MMVINNNIAALTTYGIVNKTSNSLEKSIKKLSTGLRINSAADDAAGLSISEKMRAQINGLTRAVSNAQDGVSLIQTAEGALTETHSILQRMRELSVQAANDTLTQQDRSYIQEEVDLLRDEIDHIGNTTSFNTKKLLNGDAAVLWSSDKLTTKAIVNGGLREIDQFGQKKSIEGNYNIEITATPGTAEVQKTDIFKVKHEGIYRYSIKDEDRVASVKAEDLDFDTNTKYTIAAASGTPAADSPLRNIVAEYGTSDVFSSNASSGQANIISGSLTSYATAELAVTIKSINPSVWDTASSSASAGTVTFTVTGFVTKRDGSVVDIDWEHTYNLNPASATNTSNYMIATGQTGISIAEGLTFEAASGIGGGSTSRTARDLSGVAEGTTALITVVNGGATNDVRMTVTGDATDSITHKYNFTPSDISEQDVTLNQLSLDTETGTISRSSVTMTFGDLTVNPDTGAALTAAQQATSFRSAGTLAEITEFQIGDVATSSVYLRDVDKFWDSQGNFMLEDPQTITITQGNGKTAKVTLYAYDTLGDVAKKLNDAIADDLGQKDYVDDDGAKNFVTFVDSETANSSESVAGTFVIRSAVAGKDGTLRFASKNEDLINALSLNTITAAAESTYDVTITDAHTGESVVEKTTITGNKLIGALNKNIDVEFDAMTGISSKWDDDNKKFIATGATDTTVLHLADNTMTFQIGANQGDDMSINIGDMRSHALGLDSVLVTDRDSASRSITIIDSAIDKVSTQRAKLGAYQNRLEHTMINLETSAENLTSAESRIRDTDMAKEMMNFTKLQIMLQAGNSMLAQANQLPQNVLSLIR